MDRRFLEEDGQPYVLAVGCQQCLWQNLRQRRLDKIADEIPADAWSRLIIADGAKGPGAHDWAAGQFGAPTEHRLRRWILIRRNIENPTERAYYLCAALPQSTMQDSAIAAGHRWSIECCFEAAKQETGLDNYEVRSWHDWYRHIKLSMAALALLGVIRVAANEAASGGKATSRTRRSTKTKKESLVWSR